VGQTLLQMQQRKVRVLRSALQKTTGNEDKSPIVFAEKMRAA